MNNHSQTILPAADVMEMGPLLNVTQMKNGCLMISSSSVDKNRFVLLPHSAWKKLQVKALWLAETRDTVSLAGASIHDHMSRHRSHLGFDAEVQHFSR